MNSILNMDFEYGLRRGFHLILDVGMNMTTNVGIATICLMFAILLCDVCYLLFAICKLLFDVCCLLFAVCSVQFAVCCSLFVVCFLVFAVCCLLSAVCCLMFAICSI